MWAIWHDLYAYACGFTEGVHRISSKYIKKSIKYRLQVVGCKFTEDCKYVKEALH